MTDTTPSPASDEEEDDVERRFREALERKQAKAKAGAAHEDRGSKIHQAHGPASARRQFRRKSG